MSGCKFNSTNGCIPRLGLILSQRSRTNYSYKHSLFHRDRPEDLHLVRRRTCPGMDGRKQRFSRFSAQKISQSDSDSKSDEDESSVEAPKTQKRVVREGSMKRESKLDESERGHPIVKKRDRRFRNVESSSLVEDPPAVVDGSLFEGPPSKRTKTSSSPLYSLVDGKQDKVDMIEQSLVVSEVAMKLDQCARKALKGRSRKRSGTSGIVTPPYGGFLGQNGSPLDVLTYDDEPWNGESDQHDSSTVGLIAQSEDISLKSEDSHLSLCETAIVSPVKARPPAVQDPAQVDEIAQRLVEGSPMHLRSSLTSTITVASFCMVTVPTDDSVLCSKILQLIASSSSLMTEFQKYRAALHPEEHGSLPPFSVSAGTPRFHASTVQQIWERTASRSDAVRDFKIFAVNCIQKILGKEDLISGTLMSLGDRQVLKRTADLWQASSVQLLA